MNIHATIREVSKHYTMPTKTGCHSWQFTAPYDITKPKGGFVTVGKAGSYKEALETRRNHIAYDTMLLLTDDYDKAANAAYDVCEQGYSIAEAVKRNIV